jgi:quercetin dioxygenase-like cupin family protein
LTIETIRRVVTAQTIAGKNVFAIDEYVEPFIADERADRGQQIWQLWGSEGIPQLPSDATENYAYTVFAPPGGYRIQICEFPASSGTVLEPRGVSPKLGTRLTRTQSDDFGSMHYTDSVDIVAILEGEIGLELEGGAEVVLRKGDVLVQNGVAHRWKKGTKPCRLCMVALGAERAEGE